jgi:hypothetical protein
MVCAIPALPPHSLESRRLVATGAEEDEGWRWGVWFRWNKMGGRSHRTLGANGIEFCANRIGQGRVRACAPCGHGLFFILLSLLSFNNHRHFERRSVQPGKLEDAYFSSLNQRRFPAASPAASPGLSFGLSLEKSNPARRRTLP